MDLQERYYTYWELVKPPFDNVPNPEMYFDLHRSVDNAVSETIFAIEEGNECLVVIVGDVGLGKAMTLRVILDSLEPERYHIAFVTNPDVTFIQLIKEILVSYPEKFAVKIDESRSLKCLTSSCLRHS
jgi:type II secretory pathway predicted ATPase ExeA